MTKQIIKTALTFIFCLALAYAITAITSGHPNPLAWPFWARAAVIMLASAATVFLTRKNRKQ